MFLDIISKIFIFVAIHAMIIFIIKYLLSQNALLFLHTQNIY